MNRQGETCLHSPTSQIYCCHGRVPLQLSGGNLSLFTNLSDLLLPQKSATIKSLQLLSSVESPEVVARPRRTQILQGETRVMLLTTRIAPSRVCERV